MKLPPLLGQVVLISAVIHTTGCTDRNPSVPDLPPRSNELLTAGPAAYGFGNREPCALYGGGPWWGSRTRQKCEHVRDSGKRLADVQYIDLLELGPFTSANGLNIVPCSPHVPPEGQYAYCLQANNDGAGNRFLLGVVEHTPSIDLGDMWGRNDPCNNIATYPKRRRNTLFLAEDQSGRARLKLKALITPSYPGVGARFVWGVLDSKQAIVATGTLLDNGRADVDIPVPRPVPPSIEPLEPVYTVVIGSDDNHDGKLQSGEVIPSPAPPQQPFKVVVTPQYTYVAERTSLQAGALFPGLFAARLLHSFLTGQKPQGATYPRNSPVSASDGRLTHIAGAKFIQAAGCVAKVPYYRFGDGTDVSDAVENSVALGRSRCEFLNRQIDEIRGFFQQNPNVSEYSFQWRWSETFRFGLQDPDLHLAFGTVALGTPEFGLPPATINARIRRDLSIKEVLTVGSMIDLYDFDYDDVLPAHKAANVQIGWNAISGNIAGGIFLTEVRINSDRNSCPYLPWP